MMQLQMCNCAHNNCYFLPLKFTSEIWYVIFFFNQIQFFFLMDPLKNFVAATLTYSLVVHDYQQQFKGSMSRCELGH